MSVFLWKASRIYQNTKPLKAELQAAKEAAVMRIQAKSMFLANMSHGNTYSHERDTRLSQLLIARLPGLTAGANQKSGYISIEAATPLVGTDQ
jgi:hypothetical protein